MKLDEKKFDPFKRTILTHFDKSNLRFVHRSFYDYYLAKFILNNDGTGDAKIRILELKEDSEAWLFYKEMADIYNSNPEPKMAIDLVHDTPAKITTNLELLVKMNTDLSRVSFQWESD